MRFIALLICLLPIVADAQDKGGRTCRLIFLGASEKDPEKLHLHDGTKTREVDLPRLNLSKVYPLPGGAITLRLLTAPPAEGEPANPAAPSATVAGGVAPEEIARSQSVADVLLDIGYSATDSAPLLREAARRHRPGHPARLMNR
jgi:hypothetical protein